MPAINLKDDPVGLDPTAFWKWIKWRGLDRTREGSQRIQQIITLNTREGFKKNREGQPIKASVTNWSAVIHQVKQEFSGVHV